MAADRTAADVSPPAWTLVYDRVRELEGRRYPDAIVAHLPVVADDDPLRDEWRRRADSAERLVRDLAGPDRPDEVVEIGCGNGWLAALLARRLGARVLGIDINAREIDQARRVFGSIDGLSFVVADAESVRAPDPRPDAIVLASVLQWVPDAAGMIRRLLDWLAPGGRIDVVDTPFYGRGGAIAAEARSRAYYERLGVPGMAGSYHHHERSILDGLPAAIVVRDPAVRPHVVSRILGRWPSPFPWITIRPVGSIAAEPPAGPS